MLNKLDQQVLDIILAKPSSELTENDIAVLRSRASYLSRDQQKEFAEHLQVKQEKKKGSSKKEQTDNGLIAPENTLMNPQLALLVADAKELGIETDGLGITELQAEIDKKLAEI